MKPSGPAFGVAPMRMKTGNWTKIGGFVLCVYLIQMSIVPLIWIGEIKPDLLQVVVIVMAMNIQVFSVMIASVLLCGLLKDILWLSLFSFNTLIFGFEAILVYLICRYVYKETKVIKYIILTLATLCGYILLSLIFQKSYFWIGCLEAVINCLLFPGIEKVYRAIQPAAVRGNSGHAYR